MAVATKPLAPTIRSHLTHDNVLYHAGGGALGPARTCCVSSRGMPVAAIRVANFLMPVLQRLRSVHYNASQLNAQPARLCPCRKTPADAVVSGLWTALSSTSENL